MFSKTSFNPQISKGPGAEVYLGKLGNILYIVIGKMFRIRAGHKIVVNNGQFAYALILIVILKFKGDVPGIR